MAKKNFIKEDDTEIIEAVEPEVTEEPKEPKFVEKVGKVIPSLLNIRAEANTNSNIVGTLSSGDTVKVIGEEGKFYKIPVGFVMKEFVAL